MVILSIDMLRSFPRAPRALRIAAVILAITAMLSVSAASVSAAHAHSKEPVDRCNVCCTAHMAAQQVAVITLVHPPEIQSILSPPAAPQVVESGVFSRHSPAVLLPPCNCGVVSPFCIAVDLKEEPYVNSTLWASPCPAEIMPAYNLSSGPSSFSPAIGACKVLPGS